MSEPAPEAAAPPEEPEVDIRFGDKHVDAPKPAQGDPGDEEPFDKDRAMSTIHTLREEVKLLREEGDVKWSVLKKAKQADKLEAQLKEIEEAKLSEQEKLAKRAEEAEAKAAEVDKRLRVANLVAELAKPAHGIVDARAAAKLIDGVEYDDDGEPANLDDVLPGFLEAHPFLQGTAAVATKPAASVDGTAGRTPGPAPALTAEELEAARAANMTPERYAALKGVENVADYTKLQASLSA